MMKKILFYQTAVKFLLIKQQPSNDGNGLINLLYLALIIRFLVKKKEVVISINPNKVINFK
jgi:hypothetical protein